MAQKSKALFAAMEDAAGGKGDGGKLAPQLLNTRKRKALAKKTGSAAEAHRKAGPFKSALEAVNSPTYKALIKENKLRKHGNK